ncbi:hypothetical protein PMKS-002765 [Pichia membranifaciens]|uniref:Uncharacterized protein n=1 Tax=Pichia membranifaciens TaxID=4926 RepID=A0A1Q2YIT6_9ASCO|nr:hypothetical protein PMKS-002765 [Pichia membranifaciens]
MHFQLMSPLTDTPAKRLGRADLPQEGYVQEEDAAAAAAEGKGAGFSDAGGRRRVEHQPKLEAARAGADASGCPGQPSAGRAGALRGGGRRRRVGRRSGGAGMEAERAGQTAPGQKQTHCP